MVGDVRVCYFCGIRTLQSFVTVCKYLHLVPLSQHCPFHLVQNAPLLGVGGTIQQELVSSTHMPVDATHTGQFIIEEAFLWGTGSGSVCLHGGRHQCVKGIMFGRAWCLHSIAGSGQTEDSETTYSCHAILHAVCH